MSNLKSQFQSFSRMQDYCKIFFMLSCYNHPSARVYKVRQLRTWSQTIQISRAQIFKFIISGFQMKMALYAHVSDVYRGIPHASRGTIAHTEHKQITRYIEAKRELFQINIILRTIQQKDTQREENINIISLVFKKKTHRYSTVTNWRDFRDEQLQKLGS